MAPRALQVEEKIRRMIRILSTSGQFRSMYLTAVSVEFDALSRGLHTQVAFNTRAGLHSRPIKRARCIAENTQAMEHVTVARIAKNTLVTCLKKKQRSIIFKQYSNKTYFKHYYNNLIVH